MAFSLLSNNPVSGQIAWLDVRLVYDGVDYVIANYLTDEYVPTVFADKKAADVTEDMYPAYALAMWNFAKVNADGTLTGNGRPVRAAILERYGAVLASLYERHPDKETSDVLL